MPAEQYEELMDADVAYTASVSPRMHDMHGTPKATMPSPPTVRFPAALSDRSGIFSTARADEAADSAGLSPRVAPIPLATSPVDTVAKSALFSSASAPHAAHPTHRRRPVGESIEHIQQHSAPYLPPGNNTPPTKLAICEHKRTIREDTTGEWDELQFLGHAVTGSIPRSCGSDTEFPKQGQAAGSFPQPATEAASDWSGAQGYSVPVCSGGQLLGCDSPDHIAGMFSLHTVRLITCV